MINLILRFLFSNFKPSIIKYILDQWQNLRNYSIGNKLLEIKSTVSEHQSVVQNIRKEKLLWLESVKVIQASHIHTYLLLGEEQPQCVGCDSPFTVRHSFLSVAISHR